MPTHGLRPPAPTPPADPPLAPEAVTGLRCSGVGGVRANAIATALLLAAGLLVTAAGAAAQPEAQPPAEAPPTPADPSLPPPGVFRFGPFAEPVNVTLFIELIRRETGAQIVVSDAAAIGTRTFRLDSPVDIPRDQLLRFLDRLLKQNNFALTRDFADVYYIVPENNVVGFIGNDPFNTTQIISTRGFRPSSLATPIATALRGAGGPGAAAGQGAQQGQGAASNIAYLDDLGVILMTDAPSRIQTIIDLIARLSDEVARQEFIALEVKHITAANARSRMLDLLTGRAATPGQPGAIPQPAGGVAQPGLGQGLGTLVNLADRLTPDPQSNRLIFKGRPDELEQIRRLLAVVDTPNVLVPRWYPVGGAATTITQLGKRRGLGEVTQLSAQPTAGTGPTAPIPGQAVAPGAQAQLDPGGPVFILDLEGRGFMYYGTPEQHAIVQELVTEAEKLVEGESIVYEFYKLAHAKAEETAEVIRSLLTSTAQTSAGTSPLLPAQGGQAAQRRPLSQLARGIIPTPTPPGTGETADGLAIEEGANVFVASRKATNELIVKAPKRLQPQFKRLIDRLDSRRPQVYIDAQIVVVDDADSFRLAFETQLIKAGGQTLAGTTRWRDTLVALPGVNQGILTPPLVPPSVGITAALIKSDQVPVVLNALASTTNARIVAAPKLLVDDNEQASIESIEERPTQTQTQVGGTGSGNVLTGFGGYEKAGPKLTVTPQISNNDYLRLKYSIELSSFVEGTATANLPPARQTSVVESDSVTIPSDSTIVVGGLTLRDNSRVVFKVPFIGDIPIVGQLFRDERISDRKRTIYVFMTPRILRDPTFQDSRHLSRGPRAAVEVLDELPLPGPIPVEILDPPLPPVEVQSVPIGRAGTPRR
jgi:general secretion pathway protein D